MDLRLELRSADGNRSQQIGSALRRAVDDGALPAGHRLPPSRLLAADLGVARGAVVEAYAQLAVEGYVTTKRGAGTFVASGIQADRGGESGLISAIGRHTPVPPTLPAPSDICFDLRPGLSDLTLFPRAAWHKAVRKVATTLPYNELAYPDPDGVAPLRSSLSSYLQRVRGVRIPPARIVVTAGSTQAVSALARALIAAGHRRLAVEEPTDSRERQILRAVGLEVVPIPVDADGVSVDKLEAAAVKAVLVAPTHQFPTGSVLSPSRRSDLVAWVKRCGGVIIEDDYDSEYQYRRPMYGSLQALAPNHVVLVGSVSKSLAPALRIGWAVAPDPLAQAIAIERAITDFGTATLDQLALAELFDNGFYARHLRHTKRIYQHRHQRLSESLRQHLPHDQVAGAAIGFHTVLTLPGLDETRVIHEAARLGVALQGVREMYASASSAHAELVLGTGQIPESRIDQAAALVAQAVACAK